MEVFATHSFIFNIDNYLCCVLKQSHSITAYLKFLIVSNSNCGIVCKREFNMQIVMAMDHKKF